MNQTDTESKPAPAAPPELMPMPEVIAQLINAQGTMSDAAFCKEYNFAYDASTWNRLKRWIEADPKAKDYGKPYYRGKLADALHSCDVMLRGIRERRAIAQKVTRGTTFIELVHFRTVIDRVTLLLDAENTPDRLVAYLAETGGGKTTLGRHIAAHKGGVFVEARESWRDSYSAALRGIAAAARCGEDAKTLGEIEDAVIGAFDRKTVLVIDEAEYFGPRSINVFKLLLNHTQAVVVLLAIPEMWNRVKRHAWAEAAQIVRRTDHTERLTLIHPSDVQRFVEAAGVNLNGSSGASCSAIASAANAFGRYDLIVRVCDRLALDEPEKPKHHSQVTAAIHAVQAMMGYKPIGGAR